MELIREILEEDVGLSQGKSEKVCYNLRKAARALIFNSEGKIAILFVSKKNYHKLPGGGIEEGEDIITALKREVLEEVGCNIEIKSQEIGAIIEYKNKDKSLQISYCYWGDMAGDLMDATLTKREIANGFKLKWLKLDEAIEILEKDSPSDYLGRFIRIRDMTFLKKAKEVIAEPVKECRF